MGNLQGSHAHAQKGMMHFQRGLQEEMQERQQSAHLPCATSPSSMRSSSTTSTSAHSTTGAALLTKPRRSASSQIRPSPQLAASSTEI